MARFRSLASGARSRMDFGFAGPLEPRAAEKIGPSGANGLGGWNWGSQGASFSSGQVADAIADQESGEKGKNKSQRLEDEAVGPSGEKSAGASGHQG